MPEEKNVFIHHVFFWLADPTSEENREQLILALQKLGKAPMIRRYHIGRPALLSRSAIDTSYTVSWCLYFNSAEDQLNYQKDSTHLRFVDTCCHLWKKVLVYDCVDM